MAESRGGGYDIAQEERAKKALSNKTRTEGSLGARASSGAPTPPGADARAPFSLGDLMTPSSFGQEPPPSNDQEFNDRVSRNTSFLSDPTTKMQLLQFGTILLGGGNIGEALSSAIGLPARAQEARLKTAKEIQAMDLAERGQRVSEEQLALNVIKEKREAKGQPSDVLRMLNEADQAEAEGRKDVAAALRARVFAMEHPELSQGIIVDQPGLSDGKPVLSDGTGKTSAGATAPSAGEGGVATTTLPSGVTITTIPGSKEDLAAKEAQKKIQVAKSSQLAEGFLTGKDVDEAMGIISNHLAPDYSVTGWGSLAQYIPGSDANRLSGLIQQISSRSTLDQLRALRESSQTGGALGQVSDYEDRLLQSTLQYLNQSQSSGQVQQNLRTIKWLFDPASIDARAEISKQLIAGNITQDEAYNRFQAMYQKATGLDDGSHKMIDLSVAPDYVPDRFKEMWDIMEPQDKRMLLNEDDQNRFDYTVQQLQQFQQAVPEQTPLSNLRQPQPQQ